MPNYMLLLYHDPSGWPKMSPEDQQRATEKYMAWTKKPFVVDTNRLTPEPGKVMRMPNGKPQTVDGPYSETKEVLGGYYTISAANYEEAVRLTADHPHLAYGGTIEVREVWQM